MLKRLKKMNETWLSMLTELTYLQREENLIEKPKEGAYS